MGKASSAAAATKTTTTTTTITSSRTATTTTATTSSAAAASAAKSPSGGLLHGMKRKKKKGRPSLLDLQRRKLQQQKQQEKQDHLAKITNQNNNKTLTPPPPSSNYNSSSRRSTRRNPNPNLNYDYSPSSSFDDGDDDDDERQQKKVKLVVRLPQSSSEQRQQREDSPSRNSPPSSSAAASDSDQDNRREVEINAGDGRSNPAGLNQGRKTVKTMGTVHGSSLVTGPTSTPLPDRTMLVFVLDRLQKKDTYGVFSEPVDPNELPDYHEIIEQPMDFGTVRKKLDDGVYTNLEELEADVMLICSNAMQYNSSDTVYYRQARSIQELAKRDFENLRNEGDDGEPQPKVVRRGRPPSKNLKKPIETSPSDRVGLEVSSGATLATGEDKASGSNGYNLRKGQSMLYKLRSNDASSGTSFRTRNGENYSDWLVDWNSEFPANILRADMKYGKKHFTMIDETRRDTYKQSHPLPSSSNQSYFSNSFGDMKRLMSVGLHMDPHAYARSLARYAANLGPVAWNVASRKLKSVLPDGLAFGPGWVEENDLPLPFLPDKLKSMNTSVPNHDYSGKMVNPSTSELSSVHRPPGEIADAGRRSSSQNELPNQGSGLSWAIPCSGNSFQTPPQKAIFHPNRNGFNGMIGFDMSSQMGVAQVAATQAGHSGWDNQILPGRQSAGNVAALHSGPQYPPKSAEAKLSDNWALARSGNSLNQASDSQMVSAMHRQSPAIPPDLNIRVQATSGSPSSSLQIGSPQPDLALQL